MDTAWIDSSKAVFAAKASSLVWYVSPAAVTASLTLVETSSLVINTSAKDLSSLNLISATEGAALDQSEVTGVSDLVSKRYSLPSSLTNAVMPTSKRAAGMAIRSALVATTL